MRRRLSGISAAERRQVGGNGKSTSVIAEQLAVSIKTIETYRANIRARLNLKDSNGLVRFAASRTEGL